MEVSDLEYLYSVKANFLAVAQIVILGGFGFYIIKRGILGQCCLKTISNLVVDVTLPLFIFTNTIRYFPEVRNEKWYLIPLYCVAILTVSAGAAWLTGSGRGNTDKKREFISLVTFQNSGFLPLILIGTLVPEAARGKFYVYVFLYLLVFNPVLFTASEKLFGKKAGILPSAGSLLNPANAATLAGLAAAVLGLGDRIPGSVFKPLEMMGGTTIPLSMVVTGGIVVVNFSGGGAFPTGFVARVAALKLLVIPALVFAALTLFKAPAEIVFLLTLEAMMPPAVILPLLAGKHDGDYLLVGQALFGVTVASLVTIPLILALLRIVPA